MRINCEVQINNRQLPSLNMSAKKRSTRSSLAIGKRPGKLTDSSDLFLHICCLQNKNGTKYKIQKNIKAVFAKFVEEGKFTIQLKEPSIDICVKADPLLAKGFLKLLKLSVSNQNIEKLNVSHLNAVKQSQIEKPKTKLVIDQRKDYPLNTTFPHYLEILKASGIQLNRIENRMTRMKYLRNLDLSENQIKEIPLELGHMNYLSILNLKGNKITKIPDKLFNGKIKQTLLSLDLSNNDIAVLPPNAVNLKKLDTLLMSSNKLTSLPLNINRLNNLKNLNVSHNLLESLPLNIQNLHLNSIDVALNPFNSKMGIVQDLLTGSAPTLKDMAAISCIDQQLELGPADVPYTLCDYMNYFSSCPCGKIVLKSYLLAITSVELKNILSASISSTKKYTAVLGSFCSKACYLRLLGLRKR